MLKNQRIQQTKLETKLLPLPGFQGRLLLERGQVFQDQWSRLEGQRFFVVMFVFLEVLLEVYVKHEREETLLNLCRNRNTLNDLSKPI